MYLFYIDESGNTGRDLDSVDQPVHWLVALGVSPVGVSRIEAEMLALAIRYFRSRARDPSFEFHGNDLFSGRGDCRTLTVVERVELYRSLLGLLRRHDMKLFIRGVDKVRHKTNASRDATPPIHPYRLAFMELVARIDEWLQERQPPYDLFQEESSIHGLLVADEQKEMDREIIEQFAYWRDQATTGDRAREIRYLIDTVHYVPSHDSWLIQLADCVAFVRNRVERVRRERGLDEAVYGPSDRAVVTLWRDHCAPQTVVDLIWP